MVKKFFITAIIICMTSLAGCQKSPINGDLDGRWQIITIETGEDIEEVKDLQLYYNFSLHICNLSYYGGSYTDGIFNYDSNLIHIHFPYITNVVGMSRLSQYGIYSNPVEFKVEYLDKKKLILKEGDNVVITLRKF